MPAAYTLKEKGPGSGTGGLQQATSGVQSTKYATSWPKVHKLKKKQSVASRLKKNHPSVFTAEP